MLATSGPSEATHESYLYEALTPTALPCALRRSIQASGVILRSLAPIPSSVKAGELETHFRRTIVSGRYHTYSGRVTAVRNGLGTRQLP